MRRYVGKMNIKTQNYKDRIESKWQCLRRGAIDNQEGKKEYDKEFNRLKRRVDRINQSVLTIEKIELKRYKIKEEGIKRAEAPTSRAP